MSGIVSLLFVLILAIVALWLQGVLSRRPAKWPGLVLPLYSFAYSILMIDPIANMFKKNTGSVSDLETSALTITITFLLTNIPTLILFGIYYFTRKSIEEKQ